MPQRARDASAPGRRAVLAGLGAALLAGAARGEPLRRVLFVGNSFTREHGVPGRVAARAALAGQPIQPHEITRNGALLAGHLRRRVVRETLGWGWEAVVLQPHSTEALYEDRRRAMAEAVAQAAELAPDARLVIFVPWPRSAGHGLYAAVAEEGYAAPRTPGEMARLNTAAAARIAEVTGAAVAPVAVVWAAALAQGVRLHASDGYHANAEGADLAARVIWASLAEVLP